MAGNGAKASLDKGQDKEGSPARGGRTFDRAAGRAAGSPSPAIRAGWRLAQQPVTGFASQSRCCLPSR
jgi:hypothetical protein